MLSFIIYLADQSESRNNTSFYLSIFSWIILVLTIIFIILYKGFITKEANFIEVWNIVNHIQLIFALQWMSTELPETIEIYLQSFGSFMLSLNVIPFREISYLSFLKQLESEDPVDMRFSSIQLVSISTVVNLVSIIWIVVIFYLLYLILKFVITYTVADSNLLFKSYWWKQLFSRSNLVRLFIEIYLFFVISVCWEIKAKSSFISVNICIIWLNVIIASISFADKPYAAKKNNEIIDEDSLSYSFVTGLNDNLESYHYPRYFLLKRIAFALILVFGNEINKVWKIFFIITLEESYLKFIWKHSPFKNQWSNTAEKCNSVFYILITFLFMLSEINYWQNSVIMYLAIGTINLNILVMSILNILSGK